MVTQTIMRAQGVGNTSFPESPPSLSRQGSFYGLTLDEVQSQLGNLGKPLGSMNLDELLRTVWSGEAIDNGSSHPSQLTAGAGSLLNRQSSFSLSADLSKKTVEEVWREIQQGKRNRNDGERNQERQNTLGEMTLEDFLAQAGVVVERNGGSNSNTGSGLGVAANATQHAQWIQYQMVPQSFINQHTQQQAMSAGRRPLADSAYSELSMSPSVVMGTLSDTQAPGRKRVAHGDIVEKTVERRHKRMIKNRESAARSRARKQAYTHELESKVSLLEEENERLRRMKEVEKVLPCAPPPEPKYQLRRTSSAPI